MTTPDDVLWDCRPHTRAKHRLLRGYLDAWMPIIGSRFPSVHLIDGFAGPGRYRGGELGSPLIMLNAFLEHRARMRIRAKLRYTFIEEDGRRVTHLENELSRMAWPADRVDVDVIHGTFDEEMARMLAGFRDRPPGPVFAFVDPFGYSDDTRVVSSRILGHPNCEILIYVPMWHIARFVTEEGVEGALDNLFGDRSWIVARDHPTLRGRVDILAETFKAALSTTCAFVRAFEINEKSRNTGYFLFFGTNQDIGLSRMKAAMWDVDPIEGRRFLDTADENQALLFGDEPNFQALRDQLRVHFGMSPFTIEQAETFTLRETDFRDDAHLKRKTLRPAEELGLLIAELPGAKRRRGSYPSGTILQFTR